MSKSELLKRKFKKVIIIFLVSVVISGALAYGAYMYSDSAYAEKQEVERTLRQKRLKVSELEQKFNIYESSFNRYNELLQEYDIGKFTLDIDNAQRVINNLRQKYRLTNLELKISSEKIYGDSNQKYEGFEPLYREVNMTFFGLSDAHIYAFINELQEELSGYVRFAEFSVTRERPMSDALYQDVRRGSTPSIVQAELSFLWIGIARKETVQP